LAEVQHVGSGGAGDVGAVVDGQQRAVASRGIGESGPNCCSPVEPLSRS
jgi:hypothetical protein